MTAQNGRSQAWGMKNRSFILAIFALFIVFSATVLLICNRHYTIHSAHILNEDRKTANLVALLFNQLIRRNVSVMESYTYRPLLLRAVRERNASKASEHLMNLKKTNPDIDILIITDQKGTLWTSWPERPESIGQNFAHREWYKNVSREWKPSISDVVLRVVREKDAAFQISVPFFDEKKGVVGILTNTERTAGLNDLMNPVTPDKWSIITIADRKGQIAYSSLNYDNTSIKLYRFYDDMKKAAENEREKTFFVHDRENSDRVHCISFSFVGDIGWTVFVGRDKSTVLRSASAYYVQVSLIAFLLFISITFLLVYSRKLAMTAQIAGQLKSEQEKRAAMERYQSYIEITSQIGWITNAHGEIIQENPSWSRYTGRAFEEIKNLGWLEDLHPDDRAHVRLVWQRAVEQKALYEVEYRVRRHDGTYRDFLTRGVPLYDDDGAVREWVGACIDISDRMRDEKAIRRLNDELEQRVRERTEQLTAANRELEAFSYSVSHDLRAPLRSIDGFSQALLEDYSDKLLDETGRMYLERVRKATQRMGMLIDDMLKLSRITKAELEPETVDLSAMAREIAAAFQNDELKRDVEVVVQDNLLVWADKYLLKIAMENLIGNAFKFTGRVAHPRIEFGARTVGEDENVFFIKDNGAGFDMNYAGKLFGAFQRLHTADEFPGNGVGLATVRRIVHRHGGKVWAEGKTGEGATFYFALPSCRIPPDNVRFNESSTDG